MSPETALDIKKVWAKKHEFVLLDSWLLIADIQGKLWRSLEQKSLVIDIILA